MSSTLLLSDVVRERAEDSCDSKAGVPESKAGELRPQERSGRRAWQETLTDSGQRRVGSVSGPGDPGPGRDSARPSLQPSLFPTLPLCTPRHQRLVGPGLFQGASQCSVWARGERRSGVSVPASRPGAPFPPSSLCPPDGNPLPLRPAVLPEARRAGREAAITARSR